MTNEIQRTIAIPNFYGPGKHVYEDHLGFTKSMKAEARTFVAREAFRYHIEQTHLNMAFYYPANDTFYGILADSIPVKVKTLPRFRNVSDFIFWQCDNDPHDEDQIIATFDDISLVWDNLKIDGKDFEEIILHSYITALN